MNSNIYMVAVLLKLNCNVDGVKKWLAAGAGRIVRRKFMAEGHKNVIDFVEHKKFKPHRLDCLCRRMLRAHFETNEQALRQLPLHKALIDYLTK